jgi:hypothetical protein
MEKKNLILEIITIIAKDYHRFTLELPPSQLFVPSMVLQYVSSTAQSASSMAPCPLHGFCPFCGPLSPLQPSVLSSALQYVPCKAFLFPLRCSVSSTDLIPLYGPVPTLQPSILSKALFPLQPSIP